MYVIVNGKFCDSKCCLNCENLLSGLMYVL